MLRYLYAFLLLTAAHNSLAQFTITGQVTDQVVNPVPFVNVYLQENNKGSATDELGFYTIKDIKPGTYTLKTSVIGYRDYFKTIHCHENNTYNIRLEEAQMEMNEVVVTGTMKEVNRLETPVPVEVYNLTFFKMNPTPSIFEAMQNVNGVRPQMNCNVCNTGDIHINGLEGPYTMVLIDGMPIVSGLSSVYGLFGIPNAIIQRVEVVKGPASSLYGSEAVGGLINVITKSASEAPDLMAEINASSWQEYNTDVAFKSHINRHQVLTGINYFNYSHPIDNNNDGFTDLTLQDRISVFQKWNFQRATDRIFSLATRYLYEDRWGGQMEWEAEQHRGGTDIYGESIYTKRWELIGKYQLPTQENLLLSTSFNSHQQNSFYGNTPYFADQKIAFSQLTWDKTLGNHDLLVGGAIRFTDYDDNTTATASSSGDNKPNKTWLPGIFLQDNISLHENQKLLFGLRYDRHSEHGNIWTPRLAYKLSIDDHNIIRFNAGTGFRVVNLFTEEHAALTGAREVVIKEALAPERSYNINLNFIKKIYMTSGIFLGIDASIWHTYFTNHIIPDYSDPNKIIYDNLAGHAITQGVSINIDTELMYGFKILAGGTYMDVFTEETINGQTKKTRPLLTEKWTGTWGISYSLPAYHLTFDYTGNLYGPMKLPVLGASDPRPGQSPWFSIQNIKVSWGKPQGHWEVYGGVKNILNFIPDTESIARADDPFDKNVHFADPSGNVVVGAQNLNPGVDYQVVASSNNPYALTFDPSYVYTSNQGIRAFLGVKYTLDSYGN